MIVDARPVPDGTVLRGDVCVIGSGIAAILLAQRLARGGRSVLVLEAGGHRSDPELVDAQRGGTAGADHEPLHEVSTRRLGGSLALWGGRLRPLDPEDLVPRAERPDSWPVDETELSGYWRAAHAELLGGAYEYEAERALPGAPSLLIPTAAPSAVTEDKLWRWSPPVRFKHFHRDLANSAGVVVYHHALVTALHQDDSGRVVEAEITKAPGHRLSARAPVFVVCAGGLDSTRLLLASRGPAAPDGVGNEHDQVGRHYMTHPVADVGTLRVTTAHAARLCSFDTTRDGVYARRFLSVRPDVRAEQGLLNLNVTMWGPDPHDPSHGDGLLSAYALTKHFLVSRGLTGKRAGVHRANVGRSPAVAGHLRNLVTTAPDTAGRLLSFAGRRWGRRRHVPSLLSPGRSGVLRLRFDAEQRPDPANRMVLLRDRDRFGMPRAAVRFRVGAADRDSYYRSLVLLQEELRRLGGPQLDLPERDWLMDGLALGDGTHQMGLLRMSSEPRNGVVDANCRVHSTPNLYVLSTAVFPTAGAAPPTLTLAALALRLADHVLQRYAEPTLVRHGSAGDVPQG